MLDQTYDFRKKCVTCAIIAMYFSRLVLLSGIHTIRNKFMTVIFNIHARRLFVTHYT